MMTYISRVRVLRAVTMVALVLATTFLFCPRPVLAAKDVSWFDIITKNTKSVGNYVTKEAKEYERQQAAAARKDAAAAKKAERDAIAAQRAADRATDAALRQQAQGRSPASAATGQVSVVNAPSGAVTTNEQYTRSPSSVVLVTRPAADVPAATAIPAPAMDAADFSTMRRDVREYVNADGVRVRDIYEVDASDPSKRVLVESYQTRTTSDGATATAVFRRDPRLPATSVDANGNAINDPHAALVPEYVDVVGGNGRRERLHVDATGNVTRRTVSEEVRLADGKTMIVESEINESRNEVARSTTITGANGEKITTRHELDDTGVFKPVGQRITAPDGTVTTIEFDGSGSTRPVGMTQEKITTDANGVTRTQVTELDPRTQAPVGYRESITQGGRIHEAEYIINKDGKQVMVSSREVDNNMIQTTQIDPKTGTQVTSRDMYDESGKLVSTHMEKYDASGNKVGDIDINHVTGVQSERSIDRHGNKVVKETDPDGNVRTTKYSPDGTMIEQDFANAGGDPIDGQDFRAGAGFERVVFTDNKDLVNQQGGSAGENEPLYLYQSGYDSKNLPVGDIAETMGRNGSNGFMQAAYADDLAAIEEDIKAQGLQGNSADDYRRQRINDLLQQEMARGMSPETAEQLRGQLLNPSSSQESVTLSESFTPILDKMESGYSMSVRIAYLLAGLGCLGLGGRAMMGRFNWSWFYTIAGALLVISILHHALVFVSADRRGGVDTTISQPSPSSPLPNG